MNPTNTSNTEPQEAPWATQAQPHRGRVAVVTGAARGIGLEIALRLARDGAHLALADTDGEQLAVAAQAVRQAGAEVITQVGDLSLEASANELMAAALAAFGRIDILVNNAGGGVILPFLAHTPETLKRTIDRNLWTVLWCCRAALPTMQAQRYGRIVTLGADSVYSGLWDHAAYNAAKGGAHALATGLAREFARDGITVNTVAPCAVSTPQLVELGQKDPALVDKFLSIIPMGRAADMAEVASMVSFVTGQVISVNGGSTMR